MKGLKEATLTACFRGESLVPVCQMFLQGHKGDEQRRYAVHYVMRNMSKALSTQAEGWLKGQYGTEFSYSEFRLHKEPQERFNDLDCVLQRQAKMLAGLLAVADGPEVLVEIKGIFDDEPFTRDVVYSRVSELKRVVA